MKNGILIGLGSIVALFLVLAVWSATQYNLLVTADQEVQKQWAQVQNNYQRRADLIPNLVNTVKGESKFEKETLIAVVNARAKVGSFQVNQDMVDSPEKLKAFDQAQGELGRALSRLMVVVEKYPDLKSNAGFRDLSAQLEGTENRITVARRDFNETVSLYNVLVRRFPTNFIAGFANFRSKSFFEATPGADKAPEVKF